MEFLGEFLMLLMPAEPCTGVDLGDDRVGEYHPYFGFLAYNFFERDAGGLQLFVGDEYVGVVSFIGHILI